MPMGRQIAARAEHFTNRLQKRGRWRAFVAGATRRRHDRDEPLVVTFEPVEPKRARSLLTLRVGERKKPAQVLVALMGLDQEREHRWLDLFRMLADRQLCADDHALVELTRRAQCSHRAIQAIAITQRDRRKPQLLRAADHFFWMRGSTKK